MRDSDKEIQQMERRELLDKLDRIIELLESAGKRDTNNTRSSKQDAGVEIKTSDVSNSQLSPSFGNVPPETDFCKVVGSGVIHNGTCVECKSNKALENKGYKAGLEKAIQQMLYHGFTEGNPVVVELRAELEKL